jgi:hypothetical protein
MGIVNHHETADWLCMEGLDILTNDLMIAKQFDTSHNSEFTKPFPVGATVRVPLPFRPKIRTGIGYVGQAIDRVHTSITVDQVFGIDLEWGSIEKALEMARGKELIRKTYLEPAFKKMAQEIEDRCALYAYQHTGCSVGTLGTNAADIDHVYGEAGQYMTEMGIDGDRAMILCPSQHRTVRNSAITYFNPQKTISEMLEKGFIGTVDRFKSYESASLYSHTSGVWTGAGTMSGANQTGSTLTVTLTAGDTVNVGDILTITGVYPINPMTGRAVTTRLKQFVVTQAIASATGGAGGDTINISPAIVGPGSLYQNVNALNVDGVALLLFADATPAAPALTGTNNLAMTKQAYALVGVPLETPTAEEWAGDARDPDTGIQIAFVRSFDPKERRWITRLDTLIGFGTFYAAEGACVRVLSA